MPPRLPDAVEHLPLARLIPYARNARTHDDDQVAKIAGSIVEFGWLNPILIDDAGNVIAGHGRLLAAQKLGLDSVPVIRAAHLTPAQVRAYRLVDNRLAELSGWDDALLSDELHALNGLGFDLGLTGFDQADLDRLMAPLDDESETDGAADDDAADDGPTPPREPVTRLGDLWQLGKHRLLCGNSADPEAVVRVMDGACAALVFTSPPYGNQRDYTTGGVADWDGLMRGSFARLPARDDAQVLVNLGLIHRDNEWQPYWRDWLDWMRQQGWRRFGLYVWDQGPGLPGDWNGRLAPAFEFVFHFNRKARKPNKIVPCKWAGHVNDAHGGMRDRDGHVGEWTHAGQGVQEMRIPDNVIRVTRHKARGVETEHPAVFPVALPEFVMRAYSSEATSPTSRLPVRARPSSRASGSDGASARSNSPPNMSTSPCCGGASSFPIIRHSLMAKTSKRSRASAGSPTPPDRLQVELWPIERLLPYAANARTHPEEQIAQIAGSIAEFGFNVPCLVDERGVLIAGHGRLIAARRLGLGDVPVIRLGHLTDAQARAFRIADNAITINGAWDDALLAAELGRLKEDGVDLDLLGFGQDELDRLLDGLDGEAGAAEGEDEAPEPPAEPVTRAGDLWLLGKHRLLCGDATNAAHVARLLDGAKPHLLVSDPPYGVDYDPAWRNEAGVSATARTGKVTNDDRADWREAWALFPGDVAYVWHAGVHARTVAESLDACGFLIRAQIIWAKPRLVLGRGDYHWQHEPCLYAVRKGTTGHWQGARDQSTLWTIATGENDEATIHATQKPVECMRRPIVNNSAKGDLVYEPFAGSGSTLIAAETVSRVCLAMEIDPRYCDVIIERWQRFAGGEAVLASDHRSFAEVTAERL